MGGMGMMGGGGDMMLLGLLRIEEVQKEIELMPDQIEALEKVGESLRAGRGNDQQPRIDFRNASEEERNKFMEEMRKRNEENAKKVTDELEVVLLPEQLDRARQIAVQQQGFMAFLDPAIVKKLGLSEEQQTKLRTQRDKSMETMRDSMRELFQSGDREAIGKKLTEMRDQQLADAKKVLDEAQSKSYEELRGEPFDLPQSAMMGGFGGGRGGRGGPGAGPGGPGGPGGGRGGRGGNREGGRSERDNDA